MGQAARGTRFFSSVGVRLRFLWPLFCLATGAMAVSSAGLAAEWASPFEVVSNTPRFDTEESPVRLAPALDWQPFDAPFDLTVSLPIGLNRDAPNLGVFRLAIDKFPAARLLRR